MLLIFVFHQVHQKNDPLFLDLFLSFIEILKNEYPIIRPGQNWHKNKLSFLLTFDDAYFDFFHALFPFFKAWKIPSLLSIPTHLISECTSLSPQERLDASFPLKNDPAHPSLCTWKELLELRQSSLVDFASHTHTHKSLHDIDFSFEKEVLQSKQILENRLRTPIESFVFPYGHMRKPLLPLFHREFCYLFRLGSSANFSPSPKNKLFYRIDGEAFLKKKGGKLSSFFLIKSSLKWLVNYVRNK